MDNTTTKPNGGNRYTAEWGMWNFDYPRYDKLLTSADEMFLSVQNNNLSYIKPFYSVLLSLYYNWRSLIYGNRRKWFMGKFKEIEALIEHWESDPALLKKVPLSLIRKERALYSLRESFGVFLL